MSYVPGQVGYWKGNRNALDSSGEENHGTWTGTEAGEAYAGGVFGGAFDFDGANYVSTPVTLGASWTVALWVSVSEYDNSYFVNQFAVAHPARLIIGENGTQMWFFVAEIVGDYVTAATNTWTHLALTRTSGGLLTSYVNGVQHGQITNTNALPSVVVEIGGTARVTEDRNSKSKIAPVRVFNRARTRDEVRSLMHNFEEGVRRNN